MGSLAKGRVGGDRNSQAGFRKLFIWALHAGTTASLNHRWGELESMNELEVSEP